MHDWNYYFHDSAVAKMVSSNDYQQGYAVGFNSGYRQGRTKAIDEFLDKVRQFVAYSYNTLSYSDIERIAEELKELK